MSDFYSRMINPGRLVGSSLKLISYLRAGDRPAQMVRILGSSVMVRWLERHVKSAR